MKPRLNSLAWMPSVTPGGNLAPSLWWSMVVAASCCGDVFQRQGLGCSSGSRERWTEPRTERSLMKICSRAFRPSDWGDPSNRTTTVSTQPRQRRSGFRTSLNVLEWPSQSPDFDTVETSMERPLQRCSSFNLAELERICREEWAKLPKQGCQAYSVIPKTTQGCNRCQMCFNKVLSKGSEYLHKCDISLKKNVFL